MDREERWARGDNNKWHGVLFRDMGLTIKSNQKQKQLKVKPSERGRGMTGRGAGGIHQDLLLVI